MNKSHPVLHFIVSLKVFSHQFDRMDLKQQHLVLKAFVLRFLSHSGTRCFFKSVNMDGCEYIIIYIHLFIFMTWSRSRLCVQQQCRVADEESGSVLTVLVPQRAASPQPTI